MQTRERVINFLLAIIAAGLLAICVLSIVKG